MPTTVYIWYPDADQKNIGHASMHIGDHSDDYDTQNYVSWWPVGRATVTSPTNSGFAATRARDVKEENCLPHVSYMFWPKSELDITKMKVKWAAIRNKPGAHYKLYGKNCATMVARVLRAGGAHKLLNPAMRASYAHNLYWTPKNIAQWCNELRNLGHVYKLKSSSCPVKLENKFYTAVGLR